jgi:hypothetical protein
VRVLPYEKQRLGVAVLEREEREDEVSLEVVADVVEALVVAAFLQRGDGACMKVFAFLGVRSNPPALRQHQDSDHERQQLSSTCHSSTESGTSGSSRS